MPSLSFSPADTFEIIGGPRGDLADRAVRAEEAYDREADRLAALRRYDVAGLPPTAVSGRRCYSGEGVRCSIAIVSIVDQDRIFFPAASG